jgi:hypothetical protein
MLIVCGLERALDHLKPVLGIELPPGHISTPGTGSALERTFDGRVFGGRTGAVAISHGAFLSLLVAADDGGWIGEGSSSPAAVVYV